MTLPSPVAEFYEELWNQRDRSRIDQILHPDVNFRGSLGAERRGHDEYWRYVEEVTGPLAEYRCDEITSVSDDRRVFARMRFSGRHVGGFEDSRRPERRSSGKERHCSRSTLASSRACGCSATSQPSTRSSIDRPDEADNGGRSDWAALHARSNSHRVEPRRQAPLYELVARRFGRGDPGQSRRATSDLHVDVGQADQELAHARRVQ